MSFTSSSTSSTSSPLGFAPQESVPLAPYTTLGIGGRARWFASAGSEQQIEQACAWAARAGVPVFVLGGGSNVLVADAGFPGLVLHIALQGMRQSAVAGRQVFTAAAGESWEALVTASVEAGCAGIECLAGIPGTVGGTPVQNVGAYGQEVAQTIQSVRCFDRQQQTFVVFSNEECQFAYRTSRFNTPRDRDRYIVTQVVFALRAGGPPALTYADLTRYFAGRADQASLAEVAEAVRVIRRTKGMVVAGGPLALRDPDTRSAGSFFKNPVVPAALHDRIAAASGSPVPSWPAPDGPDGASQRKLPAAWLVEQAGFSRGFRQGGAALSSKHTLALTNHSGQASMAEILALRDILIEGVWARFGIRLEPEPILIG